jgi:hypothetical protein
MEVGWTEWLATLDRPSYKESAMLVSEHVQCLSECMSEKTAQKLKYHNNIGLYF